MGCSQEEVNLVEVVDYMLPKIDLSNWKVTLPSGNAAEVKTILVQRFYRCFLNFPMGTPVVRPLIHATLEQNCGSNW